jgi:hypothetical protein
MSGRIKFRTVRSSADCVGIIWSENVENRHCCFQNDHTHHVLQRLWKYNCTDGSRIRTKWLCLWIVTCFMCTHESSYVSSLGRYHRNVVTRPDKRYRDVIFLVKLVRTQVDILLGVLYTTNGLLNTVFKVCVFPFLNAVRNHTKIVSWSFSMILFVWSTVWTQTGFKRLEKKKFEKKIISRQPAGPEQRGEWRRGCAQLESRHGMWVLGHDSFWVKFSCLLLSQMC